jgi:hypothetical protein
MCCIHVLDMLRAFYVNVSKLDLNILTLQILFFNVADVAFRCCKHVMLGVVSRRREKRLLMLDVARNTGRNMVAI